MSTYAILGTVITLIPVVLIVTIVIKRGKNIFDSE
jgi:hypothetical protein